MTRILKHGENHVRVEVRLLHHDGSYRLIESIGSLAPSDSPIAGLVMNSRDITERRQTEQLHEMRTRQQTAIAELSRFALQGSDLPAMFDKAVALAAATLGIEGRRGLRVVARGRPSRCPARAADSRRDRRPRAGGKLAPRPGAGARIATTRWWSSSLPRSPNCRIVLAEAMAERPASALSVLIQAPERPFGTLCVLSAEPRRFSEEDIIFLQTMADLVSTAIVRRRNEEALRVVEARHQRIVANTPGMVFQFLDPRGSHHGDAFRERGVPHDLRAWSPRRSATSRSFLGNGPSGRSGRPDRRWAESRRHL